MTQIADFLAKLDMFNIASGIALLGFLNALIASWRAEVYRDHYHYVSATLALLWYTAAILLMIASKK